MKKRIIGNILLFLGIGWLFTVALQTLALLLSSFLRSARWGRSLAHWPLPTATSGMQGAWPFAVCFWAVLVGGWLANRKTRPKGSDV